MKVKVLQVGPIGTNCYILEDETTNLAAVIDPGDDEQRILAALKAGDLEGVARRMYNVFEDVMNPRQYARVAEIKQTLIQKGALGANMSGSGPTAFGLFDSQERAEEARAALDLTYRDTFLCQSV